MGLFSRKQVVRTEEFCGQLYDYWFSLLDPNSPNASALGQVLRIIEKEDPRFSEIPEGVYIRESLEFQFEAFSHVWQGRFGASKKPVRTQGEFTKHYLAAKGFEEIWKRILTYNHVIANVNTTYQNPGSAIACAGRAMSNEMRVQAVDELRNSGCDNEVAGRIANRVGDLRPWTRPDQELQKQLAEAFAGRLKPEIARGPLESLKLVVSRTYGDFVEMTKNLKVVD